jgi:sulfhydrogenase subunit beta (sulfur reductase)
MSLPAGDSDSVIITRPLSFATLSPTCSLSQGRTRDALPRGDFQGNGPDTASRPGLTESLANECAFRYKTRMASSQPPQPGYLARSDMDVLLAQLRQAGYRCIGPRLRDGAIVYDEVASSADFPAGVQVEQSPGRYRTEQTTSSRVFAWSTGPQALKPLLFQPRETLWQVERAADGALRFQPAPAQAVPTAVIGVRSCDLAALALQDRHFLPGEHGDPYYQARRSALLLIVVNCTFPAETCFCASTGDGPVASAGFDLVLDELDEGFLVRAGSPAGERLLAGLPLTSATPAQQESAARAGKAAAARQTRRLPGGNLYPQLLARHAHAHWQDVAGRCLSCGNCTSVCPTCFCFRERDQAPFGVARSTHVREWDSCFSAGHSYIHNHTIHADTRLRYRQWLLHKLGSWHAQYGRSGCVGCGRCIAWCPTGIDLTAEIAALLEGAP